VWWSVGPDRVDRERDSPDGIYDLEAPSPSGGPTEEFTVRGPSGAYQPRSIVAARTYRILVTVRWSFVAMQGEETHLFDLRAVPD